MPRYRDIAAVLAHEIATEAYFRMPTLRQLAQRWDCSIHTVHKAIGVLQSQGLVVSRQGSGVQLRRELQSRVQRVLVLYPNWNTLKEEGFAARLLIGVSRAANEFDCDLRHIHYDTIADLTDVARRIRVARCDGVIWANPPSGGDLSHLIPADCPVVSTHRWYVGKNGMRAPRTVDDFAQGFADLCTYWRQRGVQRVGILCHRRFDTSYAEHEQLFLDLLPTYGMCCPHGACLRDLPFDTYAREVLLRDFARRLPELDAVFSFTPNYFEELKLYTALPPELNLAYFDSGSYPGPNTAVVLRSQLTEHCRAAFILLCDYKPQQHSRLLRIPMVLEQP